MLWQSMHTLQFVFSLAFGGLAFGGLVLTFLSLLLFMVRYLSQSKFEYICLSEAAVPAKIHRGVFFALS